MMAISCVSREIVAIGKAGRHSGGHAGKYHDFYRKMIRGFADLFRPLPRHIVLEISFVERLHAIMMKLLLKVQVRP